MGAITANLLPIICLCFTVVHCDCDNKNKPWVNQTTFVEGGKPFIEFTCGAYLEREERLTWYKEPKMSLTEIAQGENGYKHIDLLWPLALLSSGDKIHCVKECPSSDTALVGYLSYAQTSSESVPIYFNRTIPPLTNQWGVMVTPDAFEDNGKSLMEFTCWAHLHQGELLSWHQTSDFKTTRLAHIKQGNKFGYKKIELQKTLEASDNGTQLYCAIETVPPNATLTQVARSQRIPILFERHIKPLETPYVTVRPSRDIVIFDEHEELEFVCGGSAPVDGRALRWSLQGPDIPILLDNQTFDKSANLNHLKLHMDPKYHRSQLYCVQNFIYDLHYRDTIHALEYGELARSVNITLLHRRQRDPRAGIHVTPGHYIDVHKPFMEFTCFAFSLPGDVLSWYQTKGLNRSVSILRMIQLPKLEFEGEQWMEFTLNKTLEQSDNGSEIYCAQQSVLPGGNLSDGSESRRISIAFQRDIKPLATTDRRLPEPNDQSPDADQDSADPASGQTTVTWWLVGGSIVLTVVVVIILTCVAKHYRQIALKVSNTIRELEAERRAELELRSRGPCPLPEELYDEVYAHGAGLKRPKRPRRAL